ncbi:hypothetical protein B0H10DRAFT_1947513 [Mycena sp. CBHHK59/15]|nr:hypothetical protein B0H10DRAFT_1947513 [Mycena sp. CBHHK59/15]
MPFLLVSSVLPPTIRPASSHCTAINLGPWRQTHQYMLPAVYRAQVHKEQRTQSVATDWDNKSVVTIHPLLCMLLHKVGRGVSGGCPMVVTLVAHDSYALRGPSDGVRVAKMGFMRPLVQQVASTTSGGEAEGVRQDDEPDERMVVVGGKSNHGAVMHVCADFERRSKPEFFVFLSSPFIVFICLVGSLHGELWTPLGSQPLPCSLHQSTAVRTAASAGPPQEGRIDTGLAMWKGRMPGS